MKKIFLSVAFLIIAIAALAQENWYVAAKAGLSIREKPSATAKALDKIPYGEKITVSYDTGTSIIIKNEGFDGLWAKTTWKGKTGYLVNSYLLPVPVPKAGVKNLKEFFAQLTAAAGAPVIVKKTLPEDYSTTLKKQLYKNGAEIHEYQSYEYNSTTYFLPDLTLQQGFLLLRLLKAFPEVIGDNEPFPLSSGTKTIKTGERKITVEKQDYGSAEPVTEKIKIEWESGASYELQLYLIDNQLVIFSSGGV
ncbi:MAG: SH3 domain-containing protein [Ferruginibacter sp.]